MYPGRGCRVYPGFLQHAGFIAMNPGRHWSSHWDFYRHLVEGDLQDAQAHRRFYDEYNAVLDLPGEYYLDCVRIVFQQYLLPLGTMVRARSASSTRGLERHGAAYHRR
jgi:poly(3-hydroxybutyrate) depolymerase